MPFPITMAHVTLFPNWAAFMDKLRDEGEVNIENTISAVRAVISSQHWIPPRY